ncbi:thioredoxin family protein [Candidatus Dependentiae bacterium]|nr:thioredoxin family protein [Candidatus Dependentiae bacterium]
MNNLKKVISREALILLCTYLLIGTPILAYEVTHTIKKIGARTQEVHITFSLQPEEHLYKDSMHLSVNSPSITLSALRPSAPAVGIFDKSFKTEKEVYTGTISFTVEARFEQSAKELHNAVLFMPFMINSVKESQQLTIPLTFTKTPQAVAHPAPQGTAQPTRPSVQAPSTPTISVPDHSSLKVKAQESSEQASSSPSSIQRLVSWAYTIGSTIKNFLSSLFSSTGSPLVRAGAAFLLGLLLSLTPCIYPMIPITVGILQASGSTSTFKNFLLALAYTLGISTIFSLFGLLAALGGPAFGELQGNPLFVLPVAALFFYFGLTMFDWVRLPIPKFLQPKPGKVQGGSLLSAYIFGAVSGTIASPCLSPGLILILHYVASSASHSVMGYLEGLGLLFLFGVGSTTPLLIIGTFSGSLKKLPRSGMWMVEIKKLIGIMLISMALYHLSHLERFLPWHILAWVVSAVYVGLGIFYLNRSSSNEGKGMNIYRTIVGIFLVFLAGQIAVQGYKALYDHWHPQEKKDTWLHDYTQAVTKAKQEGKLLFADIGASYCSACKSLHNSIFIKQPIKEALEQFVVLGVESDIHTDSYKQLRSAYSSSIEGFPTYLVINPDTGKILKDWSVDIEELGINGLKAELNALAQAHVPKTPSSQPVLPEASKKIASA